MVAAISTPFSTVKRHAIVSPDRRPILTPVFAAAVLSCDGGSAASLMLRSEWSIDAGAPMRGQWRVPMRKYATQKAVSETFPIGELATLCTLSTDCAWPPMRSP